MTEDYGYAAHRSGYRLAEYIAHIRFGSGTTDFLGCGRCDRYAKLAAGNGESGA